jgi:hypothetical protein
MDHPHRIAGAIEAVVNGAPDAVKRVHRYTPARARC